MSKHLFIPGRESVRDQIKLINKVLTHGLTIFIGALCMLVRGQLQKEKWLNDMKVTKCPPQNEWWLMKAGNLECMVLSTEQHLNREEGLSPLQFLQTSSRQLIKTESLLNACCLCFPPSLPPSLAPSLPLSLFVCVAWLVWACLSAFLIVFIYFRRKKSRLSGTP